MIESLEHVPTNDLIDELISRFDHAVFGGKRDTTDNKFVLRRRWRGDEHVIVGLCSDVATRALEQLHAEERDVTDEDEA